MTQFTTRIMTGKVTIPMTRRNKDERVPSTSADEWRSRVSPAQLEGFRRTSNYELSEDRRTLAFTITDEEMPEELPPEG
ncbi:hypothetical protein [Gemmata sp.]|uniref:hypothetical protein n=1 Tax=Gemmata sp. TaxID=1914242 RepID=UPI003F720445